MVDTTIHNAPIEHRTHHRITVYRMRHYIYDQCFYYYFSSEMKKFDVFYIGRLQPLFNQATIQQNYYGHHHRVSVCKEPCKRVAKQRYGNQLYVDMWIWYWCICVILGDRKPIESYPNQYTHTPHTHRSWRERSRYSPLCADTHHMYTQHIHTCTVYVYSL